MSTQFPVGSTFEVVAGMKNTIFTATSDLRNLYIDFMMFMYISNTNQIKCFQTINGRKTLVSLEKAFFELHNELMVQYRYAIEFVDVQAGTTFVFCDDQEEVIDKLQYIKNRNRNRVRGSTLVVHNTMLAERSEGTIEQMIQKFTAQKVQKPDLELRLDYKKEFVLLLDEAINGETDMDKIIAKHILAYLTNKMAKQKDNK